MVFDGCWRNHSKSFLLLVASTCLVNLPHLSTLYPCISLLLSLISSRRKITLQLISVSTLPQHHPPARLTVPEQHHFVPPRSFWKGFLHPDESLGQLQGDPAVPCFRFVLLEVAAPHLPVQTGSLHGRYVYYGICRNKKPSHGRTVSSWYHQTLSRSQEYPLLQCPHWKGGYGALGHYKPGDWKRPNHFLHHIKLCEAQNKLLIMDEWARLYSYKKLLSSTLSS